eukprot:TRINITY_DN792_c1_g4_i1.p1 TRINITY_DN792_c1_g4~~TRINITY_DN792_c1_g4_i1.p1  ORF type:complete len:965 (+),score=160.41 TRINITY_DN792_c1_g4_i1:127-3021(+)
MSQLKQSLSPHSLDLLCYVSFQILEASQSQKHTQPRAIPHGQLLSNAPVQSVIDAKPHHHNHAPSNAHTESPITITRPKDTHVEMNTPKLGPKSSPASQSASLSFSSSSGQSLPSSQVANPITFRMAHFPLPNSTQTFGNPASGAVASPLSSGNSSLPPMEFMPSVLELLCDLIQRAQATPHPSQPFLLCHLPGDGHSQRLEPLLRLRHSNLSPSSTFASNTAPNHTHTTCLGLATPFHLPPNERKAMWILALQQHRPQYVYMVDPLESESDASSSASSSASSWANSLHSLSSTSSCSSSTMPNPGTAAAANTKAASSPPTLSPTILSPNSPATSSPLSGTAQLAFNISPYSSSSFSVSTVQRENNHSAQISHGNAFSSRSQKSMSAQHQKDEAPQDSSNGSAVESTEWWCPLGYATVLTTRLPHKSFFRRDRAGDAPYSFPTIFRILTRVCDNASAQASERLQIPSHLGQSTHGSAILQTSTHNTAARHRCIEPEDLFHVSRKQPFRKHSCAHMAIRRVGVNYALHVYVRTREGPIDFYDGRRDIWHPNVDMDQVQHAVDGEGFQIVHFHHPLTDDVLRQLAVYVTRTRRSVDRLKMPPSTTEAHTREVIRRFLKIKEQQPDCDPSADLPPCDVSYKRLPKPATFHVLPGSNQRLRAIGSPNMTSPKSESFQTDATQSTFKTSSSTRDTSFGASMTHPDVNSATIKSNPNEAQSLSPPMSSMPTGEISNKGHTPQYIYSHLCGLQGLNPAIHPPSNEHLHMGDRAGSKMDESNERVKSSPSPVSANHGAPLDSRQNFSKDLLTDSPIWPHKANARPQLMSPLESLDTDRKSIPDTRASAADVHMYTMTDKETQRKAVSPSPASSYSSWSHPDDGLFAVGAYALSHKGAVPFDRESLCHSSKTFMPFSSHLGHPLDPKSFLDARDTSGYPSSALDSTIPKSKKLMNASLSTQDYRDSQDQELTG